MVQYTMLVDMGRPKEFSRDDVLDKAIQVFWKKGFADTSLQDLEKATGVNKSGLYSEFKDKEDLYLECLKRYSKTSGIVEILEKEPLGIKNIESFLLSGTDCSGQKGCFLASSVREVSIIPAKAKTIMQTDMQNVNAALIKNLKAIHPKKDVTSLAQMILTYRSGICLSMNMGSADHIKKQVTDFLLLIG